MKTFKSFLVLAILFTTFSMFAQSTITIEHKEDIIIGEHISFLSEILDETKEINIYLPLNYSEDTTLNYPVIYVLDGAIDEDFIHISGLVQFGSASWVNLVPNSIVVGIVNKDRQHDFTFPSQNKKQLKKMPTSGGSEKYIQFLKNELLPLINETYRVSDVKTVIGQSLGGLLATEILFINPDLFDNYIIISPSLWWDNASLLETEIAKFQSQKRIYIAIGNEDKKMNLNIDQLKENE